MHADLSEYNILYHVDDSVSEAQEPTKVHFSDPAEPGPTEPTIPDTDTPASKSGPSGESASAARGHLHIIDVSQSVEHDHPHAFDFLRADLRNVEDFFARRGVPTVGLRRAFEFVTRDAGAASSLVDEDADTRLLREWMASPASSSSSASASAFASADHEGEGEADGAGVGASEGKEGHEDAVFMRSYIPRTLNEVFDPERDVEVLSRGDGAQLIYKDTIGVVGPGQSKQDPGAAKGPQLGAGNTVRAGPGDPAPRKKAVTFANARDPDDEDEPAHREEEGEGEGGADEDSEDEGEDADEDEDAGEEESGEEQDEGGVREKKPRGHRHEDKDSKKVRGRPSRALLARPPSVPEANRVWCYNTKNRSARRRQRRRRERSANTKSPRRKRSVRSRPRRVEVRGLR